MLPSFAPIVLFWKCQSDYLAQNNVLIERIQLVENLQSARCSPFVIFKVLAARKRKLITARALKNKRTARMLANARKDHSIPLQRLAEFEFYFCRRLCCHFFGRNFTSLLPIKRNWAKHFTKSKKLSKQNEKVSIIWKRSMHDNIWSWRAWKAVKQQIRRWFSFFQK